jgi:hypothetical protein
MRCTFTVASAIVGNLFAQAAARYLNHDLAFPPAKRGKTRPEVHQN